MKKPITLILFLIFLNGFCQAKHTIVAKEYKTSQFHVAIFPETYIDLIPGTRFTPTTEEINKAEQELENNLKKINQEQINQAANKTIHKRMKKYYRQYFGYIDSNGSRILLINAIWKKSVKRFRENWLEQRIYVLDGGSNYWQVKYNLDSNQLFELSVNGHG